MDPNVDVLEFQDLANAAKSGKQVSGYVHLTPDLANAMIEATLFGTGRYHNRTTSLPAAKLLAGEILAGRWVPDDNAIRFDVYGRLIDGLHRLHAIIIAGIPVIARIALNLPPEAAFTINRSRPESHTDSLAKRGLAGQAGPSAVARTIFYYENCGVISAQSTCRRPSFSDLDAILIRHPRLLTQHARGYGLASIVRPGIYNFIAYALGQAETRLRENSSILGRPDGVANRFIDVANNGGGGNGDPAQALHQYLLNCAANGRRADTVIFSAFCLAWKKCVAQARILKIGSGPQELKPVVLGFEPEICAQVNESTNESTAGEVAYVRSIVPALIETPAQ